MGTEGTQMAGKDELEALADALLAVMRSVAVELTGLKLDIYALRNGGQRGDRKTQRKLYVETCALIAHKLAEGNPLRERFEKNVKEQLKQLSQEEKRKN
jgi:hypothetical protein